MLGDLPPILQAPATVAVVATVWLLLGVAVVALIPAVRRVPARAHAVLVTTAGAALIAPAAILLVQATGLGFLAAPPTVVAAPASAATGDWAAATTAAAPTWPWIVLAAWAMGSLLIAGRTTASIVAALRLRRHATDAPPNPRLERLVRTAAQQVGMRRPPRLLEVSDDHGPAAWCGFGRPAILLGPRAHGLDDAALTAILRHEAAHLRRRDHWSAALVALLAIVLPWNPVVWLVRRAEAAAREQACDAWAARDRREAARFAHLLCDLATPAPAPLVLGLADGGSLAGRVHRLLDAPPARTAGRSWTAVTLAVAGIALTATAFAQPGRSELVTAPSSNAIAPGPATADLATTDPAPTIHRRGSIEIRPGELDLGVVPAGHAAVGTLDVRNAGPAPIRIAAIRVSCGCTTVLDFEPLTLDAGASTSFDVRMEGPDAPGDTKTKDLRLILDGHDDVVVPIHLRSEPAEANALARATPDPSTDDRSGAS